MKKEKEYTKLVRFKRSMSLVTATAHSLWIGKDHLLSIRKTYFQEEYKRFYFRDIQGLSSLKTSHWIIWSSISGIFALLFGIGFSLAAKFSGIQGFNVMAVIFGGMFGVALILNLLLGPTCKCFLQTSVHCEPLPSLNRLRNAKKIFLKLKSLIEQEQGTLVQEQFVAWKNNLPVTVSEKLLVKDPLVKENYRSIFQEITAYFLLLDMLITTADIFWDYLFLTYSESFISMGLLVCVIGSITRQSQSNVSRGLKVSSWMTLGYIILTYAFSFCYMTSLAIENPELLTSLQVGNSQWMKIISQKSSFDSPLLLAAQIVSIICTLILAVSQFFLIYRFRSDLKSSHGHAD